MNHQENQTKLYAELDLVIDLANKAQSSIADNYEFYTLVARLFQRIHVIEALRNEADLCALEITENAARQT